MGLEPEDIDAIAERVVERLTGRDKRDPAIGLATAADVAQLYGVTASWVYANKKRLGAVKLGDGPRARLRFDLEQVHRELLATAAGVSPRQARLRRRGRPRKATLPPGVELLRGRRN